MANVSHIRNGLGSFNGLSNRKKMTMAAGV
jgi:hypothetical protein